MEALKTLQQFIVPLEENKMLLQVSEELDWSFLKTEIKTRSLTSFWNKLQIQGYQL